MTVGLDRSSSEPANRLAHGHGRAGRAGRQRAKGLKGDGANLLKTTSKGPSNDETLRRDNSWHLAASGRFAPGQKPSLVDLGLFDESEVKSSPVLGAKRGPPQTQIVLMPVTLGPKRLGTAPVAGHSHEDGSDALENALADKTMPRCASSPGISRADLQLGETKPPSKRYVGHSQPPSRPGWPQRSRGGLGPLQSPATTVPSDGWSEKSSLSSPPPSRGKKSRTTLEVEKRQAVVFTDDGEESPVSSPLVSRHSHMRRMSKTYDADDNSSAQFERRDSFTSDGQDGDQITLKDYVDMEHDRKRSVSGGLSFSSSFHPQGFADGPPSPGGSIRHQDEEVSCPMDAAARLAEEKRNNIRKELVRAAGGAMEAFRTIDLSGSQRISPAEFNDGLVRMGIDWQESTGIPKISDLFKLFDRDKNGAITLEELFPEEHVLLAEPQRMSTPEFWNHWCRRTSDTDRSKGPKWIPASREEELSILCRGADDRQGVADERRRMAAMIRRLKNQGKSDGKCRECVAIHLPRGTGPKDRDGVATFDEGEVRQCRRSYEAPIIKHARNIQKSVYDMRETRRELENSRKKLWTTTMEPLMRAKAEEHTKKMVEGLSLFGPPSPGSS